MSYETHDFYCIRCGKKTLPLARKVNHKHSKHHRKKLWCPTCKMEINCVECRSDTEVAEFLENFKNGVYQKELEYSLNYIQNENKLWS